MLPLEAPVLPTMNRLIKYNNGNKVMNEPEKAMNVDVDSDPLVLEKAMNVDSDPLVLGLIRQVNNQRSSGNFDNMLPLADVVIPDAVVIACPIARQHLAQAKNCKKCKHLNGIVQIAFSTTDLQWSHQYGISCGFPVDRKCSMVCLGDG